MSRRFAPHWVVLLMAWFALSAVQAQTPAGTQIVNQARASVGGQGTVVPSNQVTSEVRVICTPRISPASSALDPVQSLVTKASESVAIPFRLSNDGNGTFLFTLSALIEPGNGWAPADVTIFRDLAANGRVDAEDPAVVALELGPRQSVALLMRITPPAGASGSILISPAARCPEGASVTASAASGGVVGGSFSRIRVLGASSPIINTALSIRDVGSSETGLATANARTRTVQVTIATSNRGADAVTQPGEREAAAVTLPLDNVAGCFTFRSAGSDFPAADVEVLIGTSWLSPAQAGALVGRGVLPLNRAQAIRMRLASLAGGEIAELIALFDLDERSCPDSLPSLTTEASVPGPEGYTTSNIGFAEIVPQRGATVTFFPGAATAQSLAPASTGERVPLGEERCFPIQISNTGDEFDSYRLLLSASVPSNRRQAVQLVLQNSANLPVDSQLGLEEGEAVDLAVCLTVLETVPPFDLQARLVSDGGADAVNARLRIGAIVEAAAIGVMLEAAPDGLVRAGGLINFLATVRNDFDDQILDVVATMGVVSVVGPDGGEIPDGVTITALQEGLRIDAESGLIRWEAGDIEPGFLRRAEFQVQVRPDLPEGARLQTVMRASSGGLGQQFAAPAVEHLVWAGGVTLTVDAVDDPVAPGALAEIRILATNPSEAVAELSLQVRVDDVAGIEAIRRSLDGGNRWSSASGLVATLAPGERVEWRVAMRVHPVPSGEIRGSVSMTVDSGDSRLRDTLERDFQIRIRAGVFERERGLLTGTVFFDVDGDRRYRAGIDRPLAGVRILLPDGRQVVSDAEGRFAFRDLAVGWWRVQLDPATTPTGIAPLPERISDHALRVWVQGLTRFDVPLVPLALTLEGGIVPTHERDHRPAEEAP
jgi:hypothetical protein